MSLLSRQIEVYDFYMGTRHWRYTDVDRDVEVEGLPYTYVRGLKRGRIMQSPEKAKNDLELSVPASLPLLDIFRPFPPLTRVHLNLKRIRVSDAFVVSAWMGVVDSIDDGDPAETKIRCRSLYAAMASNALRPVWQIPCWKPLYSAGFGLCNVNPDDYRTDTVLAEVDGFTVRAAALADHGDGWYSGGVMRWDTGTGFEHRFIVAQAGDEARLMTPAGVPAGTAVSLFPGCDHSLQTCVAKFNNAPNHGGHHTIPAKNAFGDPVF